MTIDNKRIFIKAIIFHNLLFYLMTSLNKEVEIKMISKKKKRFLTKRLVSFIRISLNPKSIPKDLILKDKIM